jgi:restriction endonuclease Mrr
LAELMIDFNLGTTTSGTYEIKRIDSDYYSALAQGLGGAD